MPICPFSIIVDNSEQTPWHFTGIAANAEDGGGVFVIPLLTGISLMTGDYSIPGYENDVTIERKSISDWFGSIGRDRERFEREMERMSKMKFAAVVIEGDWHELLINTAKYSQVSPKTCQGTITSWSVRYGVHFFTSMNRRHAEITAFHLLNHFWKNQQPTQ